MLLQAISKGGGILLLAFVLATSTSDSSRQLAIDGQRITSLEEDVKDMKPLIAQMAAIKQTVDTDHQILMAIGIAMALDIIARLRGKRKDDPEPEKSKAARA